MLFSFQETKRTNNLLSLYVQKTLSSTKSTPQSSVTDPFDHLVGPHPNIDLTMEFSIGQREFHSVQLPKWLEYSKSALLS